MGESDITQLSSGENILPVSLWCLDGLDVVDGVDVLDLEMRNGDLPSRMVHFAMLGCAQPLLQTVPSVVLISTWSRPRYSQVGKS